MPLEKSDLSPVALDEMNRTHEREVEIIHALHKLIISHQAGQPVLDDLEKAVDEFARHMEQHFAREEQLMEQSGFPAFHVHKGEHDRVRTELAPVFAAWSEQRDITPLARYLEDIHPAWAKNHIATMDMMTALFISQSGG